jgi:hypothetical protein
VNGKQHPTSWGIKQFQHPAEFEAVVAENIDMLSEQRATRGAVTVPNIDAIKAREANTMGEFVGEVMDEADKTATPQFLTEWAMQVPSINMLKAEIALAEKLGDVKGKAQAEAQLHNIHHQEMYDEMRSIRNSYGKEISSQAGWNGMLGITKAGLSVAKEYKVRFV